MLTGMHTHCTQQAMSASMITNRASNLVTRIYVWYTVRLPHQSQRVYRIFLDTSKNILYIHTCTTLWKQHARP